MQYGNRQFFIVMVLLANLVLAACGGGSSTPAGEADTSSGTDATGSSEGVTVRYSLWDSNQQPTYEACVAAFIEQNPDINIKIE